MKGNPHLGKQIQPGVCGWYQNYLVTQSWRAQVRKSKRNAERWAQLFVAAHRGKVGAKKQQRWTLMCVRALQNFLRACR